MHKSRRVAKGSRWLWLWISSFGLLAVLAVIVIFIPRRPSTRLGTFNQLLSSFPVSARGVYCFDSLELKTLKSDFGFDWPNRQVEASVEAELADVRTAIQSSQFGLLTEKPLSFAEGFSYEDSQGETVLIAAVHSRSKPNSTRLTLAYESSQWGHQLYERLKICRE